MIIIAISYGHIPESYNVTRADEVVSLMKQPPTMYVYGTDYFINESGNIFVQVLLDGIAIDNSTCIVTAWFPNQTSVFIDNQLMLFHERGIHFFTFVVPEVEGIYMVAIECSYLTKRSQYFEADEIISPNLTIQFADDVIGNNIVLNSYQDGLYQFADAFRAGAGNYVLTLDYQFQRDDINLTNQSNPRVAWAGETDSTPFVEQYYFDFNMSQFVRLNTTLLMSTTILPSVGVPSGVNEVLINILPMTSINLSNNAVIIRLNFTDDNDFDIWSNFLTIASNEFITTSENEIRGGGELHVNNLLPEFRSEVEQMSTSQAIMLLVVVLIVVALILLSFATKVWPVVISVLMFVSSFFLLQDQSLGTVALIPFALAVVAMIKLFDIINDGKGLSSYIQK